MPVILYKNCKPIEDVYEEIRVLIKNKAFDSFILIVPTRRKVRELQRELLKITTNQTSPVLNIFTLETFALKLYEIFFEPIKYLNATTQAILFEQAIKNCQKDLKYFYSASRTNEIPKGTFNKIIAVINNLKESGIYLSSLYSELENAGHYERDKLNDIILIYQEYEKLLENRFVDIGGIYKKLNDVLPDNTSMQRFFDIFPDVQKLFVTGFDEFSNPEITMIDAVSNFRNKDKYIATIVSFDYYPDNEELFGHLRENYEKFISMGFLLYSGPNNNSNSFTNLIVKNAFKEGNATCNTDFKEKITLIKAETRQKEVEIIAKIIKYTIHKNPEKDLSKICICMYQPQLYTNLFHEIFSRYGIPANITDRFSLAQSPVVVSIMSLLNVLNNNFMRRDLMRALSSPYFTFYNNGEKIDAGNLISVSSVLKINYGKNIWIERIDKRIKQIEVELADSDDETTQRNYEKEIEILSRAKKDFEAFVYYLNELKQSSTPSEFRSRFLKVLEKLQVSENILNFNFDNPELLEKDTRAYQKFLNLFDEFTAILISENGEKQKYSLKFYIDKLKAAISQTRYNIRQKYGYGVYVTSIEETRGLEFETMFLAGLVDGEFPQPYNPEIFFSRERQRQKEKYHLTENRYLFYQAVTNFKEHLYLSYPLKDKDIELVGSPFIDALLNTVEVEFYDDKLKNILDEIIFDEEELLSRIGFNLSLNPELVKIDSFENRIRETINFISYAINVEKMRYLEDINFEYNGFIFQKLSEETKKKLIEQKTKAYSITQLEKYAKCPFSYFLTYLLRISVIKEPEEGITPIEKGSILHEILFEFYKNRRDKNLPLLSDCDENTLNSAIEEILSIANEKLKLIETNDVLAFLDKELILGTKEQKGLLEEFVNYEHKRNIQVKPMFFEVTFGGKFGSSKRVDEKLNYANPIEIDNYKIRGKVDRIDIGDDYFAIVDYKTGKTEIEFKNIQKGLALQLPVYLYAIEKLLEIKEQKKYSPAAAIYYNFSDGVNEKTLIGNLQYADKAYLKKRQKNGIFNNDKDLRDIISIAIEYVKKYIQDISEGKFPLISDENIDNTCKYCEYNKICRKQLTTE